MDGINKSLILFIIVTVFTFTILLDVYKYKDCKKVGHDTFYCVLSLGK